MRVPRVIRVSWPPHWGSPWTPAAYRKQCHGCGEVDRVMHVGAGVEKLRLCSPCHEAHRLLLCAEDEHHERAEGVEAARWHAEAA